VGPKKYQKTYLFPHQTLQLAQFIPANLLFSLELHFNQIIPLSLKIVFASEI